MPRILYVDDNPGLLKLFGWVLPQHGYEVVSATNDTDATVLIKRHAVDLVISDWLHLPLGGYGLYEWLRAGTQTRKIPVLIFSGSLTKAGAQQLGLYSDRVLFLRKPSRQATLLAALRALLYPS